ncbi:hypothetical protein KA005_27655 [bacterium]|nr:hypothetical protein [bacterium]
MKIRKRFELAEDSEVTAIGRLVVVLIGVRFLYSIWVKIVALVMDSNELIDEWIMWSIVIFLVSIMFMFIGLFIIYLLGLVVFWILDDYDWDDVICFVFTIYKMVFGDYEGKWGKDE